MPILVAPLVVPGERDARWLGPVLADLVESGYFAAADTPALAERAGMLASECQQVATSGRALDAGGDGGHDRLMTYDEAARWLGVSRRTLCRRVADGSLPATRVGRLVRLRLVDVEHLGERVS
jgi:excisionase family DNA binding protein